jgi:hypothetical protein
MAEQPAFAWVLRAGQAVAVEFLFISASTRFGFFINVRAKNRRLLSGTHRASLISYKLKQYVRSLQQQNEFKIDDMIRSAEKLAAHIPACVAIRHLPFSSCSN